MAADFLGSCIKFVAYHRNVLSPILQFLQHLHHVRIRFRIIHIVHHIMLAEILQGFLKLLILQSSRHGTFHKFLHPVSYKHAYLLQRTFRHPVQLQRIIAACSQVVERRYQGSVKIEDIGIEIELGMNRNPLDAELTAV